MKKMLSVATIIATGLFVAQASAASMECYVDTQAYDYFSLGSCNAVIANTNKATAVFRVTDTNKPISSVVWGESATSCGTSGPLCSFTIGRIRQHTATATILYQDGTWDTASAVAWFEDDR